MPKIEITRQPEFNVLNKRTQLSRETEFIILDITNSFLTDFSLETILFLRKINRIKCTDNTIKKPPKINVIIIENSRKTETKIILKK